jgi:transposase InsO family protein
MGDWFFRKSLRARAQKEERSSSSQVDESSCVGSCYVPEVRSFTARDVIRTLQYLFAVRGAPQYIRSDNGPEFIAKELQTWLSQVAVRTLYIQKASPWGNGYMYIWRALTAASEKSR